MAPRALCLPVTWTSIQLTTQAHRFMILTYLWFGGLTTATTQYGVVCSIFAVRSTWATSSPPSACLFHATLPPHSPPLPLMGLRGRTFPTSKPPPYRPFGTWAHMVSPPISTFFSWHSTTYSQAVAVQWTYLCNKCMGISTPGIHCAFYTHKHATWKGGRPCAARTLLPSPCMPGTGQT